MQPVRSTWSPALPCDLITGELMNIKLALPEWEAAVGLTVVHEKWLCDYADQGRAARQRALDRGCRGSRPPQPRDQSLHSTNKRRYFQYAARRKPAFTRATSPEPVLGCEDSSEALCEPFPQQRTGSYSTALLFHCACPCTVWQLRLKIFPESLNLSAFNGSLALGDFSEISNQ